MRVMRTQMSKVTAPDPDRHLLQFRGGGRGGGRDVLYCDGSLNVLVIPTALAELLSCKLLSSLFAGITQLYVIYMI